MKFKLCTAKYLQIPRKERYRVGMRLNRTMAEIKRDVFTFSNRAACFKDPDIAVADLATLLNGFVSPTTILDWKPDLRLHESIGACPVQRTFF